MSEHIDPTRYFQVKGEVCQMMSAFLSASVANDQTVITAVSGKRIRVMGLQMVSGGAGISTTSLKNGSGGTFLASVTAPANTSATPNVFWPIAESGYFETDTGVGLFIDVGTTACNVTILYLTYTPQ